MASKYTFDEVKKAFEDKNYILLSDESEFKTVNSKLRYLCLKHKDKGELQIDFNHLKMGRGCYYCGRERTIQASRKDDDYYIKIADKNGFDFIDTKQDKYGVRLLGVICRKHKDKGIQYISRSNMVRNKGCKYCAGNIPKEHDQFVSEIYNLFGDDVTIVGQYIRQNGKIKAHCNIHNIDYESEPSNMLRGFCGCPKCSHSKSNGEKRVEYFLKKWNINYIYQYSFDDCKDKNKLPFDFYLPQGNLIIEYDGEHHYRPINYNGHCGKDIFERTKKHDKIKNEYCANHNVGILRIPYYDYDEIEDILLACLVKHNILEEITIDNKEI